MHWMKRVDHQNNTVTFAVIQAYRMRKHLRKMGFHFESKGKKWVCVVESANVARIDRIETFLRASATGDLGPKFPSVFRG